MSLKRNIFFVSLSIASFSGLSQANDPFAEMDAEINSSHANSSAQWQQKRADDAFADMEREMREYRESFQQPEKKSQTTEPVKVMPQPVIIVVPERIVEREVPVKAVVKTPPVIAPQPEVNVSPPITKKAKSSEKTVRTKNYAFELKGCFKSGNDVSCNLSVTSKKQDKTLTFYGSTHLFDNLGNEYRSSSIRIANSHRRMPHPSSSISKQLISDVPTKVVITFNNVSDDALSVPKFNIKANSQSSHFNVTYRGFALSAE